MNQMSVVWDKDSIYWRIGDINVISMQINPRMDYSGNRRRARNTAVEMKVYSFFTDWRPDTYKQMPWGEAIENLRNLGATKDEIARFAHMGYEIGWSDIQEVMLYNGQDVLF